MTKKDLQNQLNNVKRELINLQVQVLDLTNKVEVIDEDLTETYTMSKTTSEMLDDVYEVFGKQIYKKLK